MTATSDTAWCAEFGIDERRSPCFLASKDELDRRDAPVPHAHVLRRAFNLFKLDSVLCDRAAPLVYFKLVRRILPADVVDLQGV